MGVDGDDTLQADPATHAAPARPRLARGDVFADRYEVEALLGRGGMGAVYRVHDRKLGEAVALKLLTLGTESAVERFLREVRLARRVTHRNVARTHDFGEEGEVRYLTMEYVKGKSLAEVVRRGALSAPEVLGVGVQIAEGLAAAHEAGVVHRDLKPENVLVAADGRVVLTDFGIARAVGGERSTRTGALLGTPHYMAPEQVEGKTADARSDVYTLGLILYELATGSLPFDGDNPIAVATARLQGAPQDPRERAPVPEPLAGLILACLERDPTCRPEGAAEVAERLGALGADGQRSAALQNKPTGTRSEPFAPMSPGERSVAVLPFAYRGAAEHDYLGEGLAEELVDVLSRTRGLSVLSLGATRRFADDRDPARIGAELEVESIVDGSVQLAGDRVRIKARLVEPDGVQRWSDTLDGNLSDVFALQESVGRRVAEALRIEIDAARYRRTAPLGAIERYLKARKLLRADLALRAEEVISLLDETLSVAPDFAPAIAAHAMASVRALFSEDRDLDGERVERARLSVARASASVPELPETQLALGAAAYRSADYSRAARSFARALEIAPTLAEAHQGLGELQLEADRPREGRERLELALELDPSLSACHLALAKHGAMTGDEALWSEHRRQVEVKLAKSTVPFLSASLRMALYRGDRAEVRKLVSAMHGLGIEAGTQLGRLGSVALGDESADFARHLLAKVEEWFQNVRFTALIQQIVVEALLFAGERDRALAILSEAAEGVLVDIVWLDRCGLFDEVRREALFVTATETVRRRAEAVWR